MICELELGVAVGLFAAVCLVIAVAVLPVYFIMGASALGVGLVVALGVVAAVCILVLSALSSRD